MVCATQLIKHESEDDIKASHDVDSLRSSVLHDRDSRSASSNALTWPCYGPPPLLPSNRMTGRGPRLPVCCASWSAPLSAHGAVIVESSLVSRRWLLGLWTVCACVCGSPIAAGSLRLRVRACRLRVLLASPRGLPSRFNLAHWPLAAQVRALANAPCYHDWSLRTVVGGRPGSIYAASTGLPCSSGAPQADSGASAAPPRGAVRR